MNPLTFWNRVNRTGDESACWNWQAARDKYGYGITSWKGKNAKAHRIAYLFTHGVLPADLEICHTCDNRACCNPAHLFEGTHWDNMQDRNRKGRAKGGNSMRGESHHSARLNNEKVKTMRKLFGSGIGVVELGRHFGVSHVCARMVVIRHSWKHVP